MAQSFFLRQGGSYAATEYLIPRTTFYEMCIAL